MDEGFEEKVRRVLWEGNGDSLVARMLVVEERVDGLTKWMEKLDKKLTSAVLGIGGVLLTLLGEMIVRGIWH